MGETSHLLGLVGIALWGLVTFSYLRNWRARKTAREHMAKKRSQ